MEVTLTASTEFSDAVLLEWSVLGVEPSHFVLERDGVELVKLEAVLDSYEDDTATLGGWTAPTNLVASQGTRADAIDLAWQVSSDEHDEHRYRLVAVARDGTRHASNTAEGWRPAPDLIGYEISRDDGESWQGVGLVTSTSDFDAPLGTLTAPIQTLPRVERDYVRLSVAAEPTFAATEVTYRVRALSELGSSPPSARAEGYRAMGDVISYQWQRSEADEDADYDVLEDVTGAIWFSRAPVGVAHYYRAALRAEGAMGFSDAERAELEPYVALSAGAFQTCGIRRDRLVSCWGGSYSEGSPPPDRFDSIDAGPSGGCGVREDGKRVCWGYSSWGADVFPHEPSVETFVSVSAGLHVSCGILPEGELTCWGDEGMAPPPAGSFKSVSVGGTHACAIDADDRVRCWGSNAQGEAPPGPSTDQFKKISAGWGAHSCGVRSDDKVVCWGRNDSGQAPAEATTQNFVSISAGVWTSCGLRSDGKIECWGDPDVGEAPIGVSPDAYAEVTTGYYHTCALRLDGGVRCWGSSKHGQVPYVPRIETFESVSIGDRTSDHPHACGITTDGKLVCWGNNEEGQAPPGPSEDTYLKVAAGSWHTCAIGADDRLSCWGYDEDGRAPPGPSDQTYSEVSVDVGSTCALATDSDIDCFGAAAGATIWGSVPAAPQALSVGGHACALDGAGNLSCWGWRNDTLGLTPISQPGPFQAVSTELYHTCALGSDQALSCWGDLNPFDDIEPSWPNERFLSIDVGERTLCGIRADDQRLVCTSTDGGAWFQGPSLDTFLSVSAGDRNFCAVRSDQKLLCLGTLAGL